MRVQSGKAQLRIFSKHGECRSLFARGYAELGVAAAGTDKRVRLSFDAEVHAKDYAGDATIRSETREPLQFLESVDGNASDPAIARCEEFIVALPGSVERQTVVSNAGALGGNELAHRANVQSDRMPGKVPKEPDRSKCLGGVRNLELWDSGAAHERIDRRVDGVELDHQRRRAVALREQLGAHSAEQELTVGVAFGQNCSMNASIRSWATPAASKRAGSSSVVSGGVTNINGALSADAAETVHNCAAAGTSAV